MSGSFGVGSGLLNPFEGLDGKIGWFASTDQSHLAHFPMYKLWYFVAVRVARKGR